jgi:hypothetical protein
MDEVSALGAAYFTSYADFRAAVDCYCLQHPEIYCVSAKSYAAHLAGLCCKMEHGGEAKIHAAIQRWLNGRVEIEKPAVPRMRGEVTVLCLEGAEDRQAKRRALEKWTASTWSAYAQLQDTARVYLRVAMRTR